MQRIHLYLLTDEEITVLCTDLETIDAQGGIVESEQLERCHPNGISSAIDEAWNEARNRGLPLLISADVVNLPG